MAVNQTECSRLESGLIKILVAEKYKPNEIYRRMHCDNIGLWRGTWRVKQKVEQPNIIAEKWKIEILGKELLTMARNEIWKMLTGNGGD